MPRALVTGATGFIGHHVVEALLARGYEVTCLVRESSRAEGLDRRCLIARGDIMDADSLVAPVAGADVVFHLASLLKVPWKSDFMRVNVEGTRSLAVAVARRASPPPLVVVSSLAASGPRSSPHTEDVAPAPISIYGRVKLASERAAAEHASEIPVTIVRPPMVYGAGDRYGLMLFRSAVRGIHAVPTFADHHLSLVHAPDLASLLVAAGEHGERVDALDAAGPRGRGVYYAAHDEQPTYAELGRLIASASGVSPPIVVRLPSFLSGAAAAVGEIVGRVRDRPTFLNLDKWREATAGSWTCDASKAKRDLYFSPRPLLVGLAETTKLATTTSEQVAEERDPEPVEPARG